MQAQPAELSTASLQALKQRAHQLLESQRSLQQQNQALAAERLGLERERVQQATQHLELSAERDALQAERDSLTAQLQELTAQRDSIQQQWETLQTTVEDLQGQLSAQSAQSAEQSQQCEVLQRRAEMLQGQVSAQHAELAVGSLKSGVPRKEIPSSGLNTIVSGISESFDLGREQHSHEERKEQLDLKNSISEARISLFAAERDLLMRCINDPNAKELENLNTSQCTSSILNCFLNYTSKSFDKWESYFNVYERVLPPLKELNASPRLLEIGVQNGGSLEAWKAYLGDNSSVVGIDINPSIASLDFREGITQVVGDATDASWANQLGSDLGPFDVIIDDGSHRCGDIMQSFLAFFRFLSPGGLYLIEDLHTSYWPDYDGAPPGTESATTPLNFFKEIVDLINIEHWQSAIGLDTKKSLPNILGGNIVELSEDDLRSILQIDSLEFSNSMVVIRKTKFGGAASLGQRMVSPKDAAVDPSPIALIGSRITPRHVGGHSQ